MNPNTENNTLIGESPVIREEIKVRIKYAEKHNGSLTERPKNSEEIL
jgi:hypothetical protein